MNLLEEEVYAVHSPIWDLHFKNSGLQKIILTSKQNNSSICTYCFNYVFLLLNLNLLSLHFRFLGLKAR